MTTSCSTVLSQTFTAHSGDWSSGHLTVGDFYEMSLDFNLSALDAHLLIAVSRVDTFGNPILIWGANEDPPAPIQESPDFGPSFAYSCTRTFGNTIQIDITTTGTFTATLSIQGKG